MTERYPREYIRKALDQVAAGRPIVRIAADMGISDQTIYLWHKQQVTDSVLAELFAVQRKLRDLDDETTSLSGTWRGGCPGSRGS